MRYSLRKGLPSVRGRGIIERERRQEGGHPDPVARAAFQLIRHDERAQQVQKARRASRKPTAAPTVDHPAGYRPGIDLDGQAWRR